MALEKELATYQRELAELLAHEGKYVLIRGDDVIETWDTYDDALKAGYQKFGLEPFMVKRIEWAETVQNFSRDIPICPRSMDR